MFEALSFLLAMAFFLAVVSALSIIVASLLGYYVLAVAERMVGRDIVPGRGRLAFSFVLGLPVAYVLSSIRQYGPFAFLLSFSVFLAVGVYSFVRIKRGGYSHAERPSRLRKHEIAGFEEERPVRKFRLREKQKVPLKLIELGDEPVGTKAPKKEPEKEGGGLFGFLDSLPNPLKSETSAEKAAKEFVLTRFGEKGSVERTWEAGGKNHAIVKSSGGRYTLTLNSGNVVVDWDKD